MRNLFITALFMLFTLTATAQKHYDLDQPKTEIQTIGKAKATKSTATYKAKEHTVYESAKGKLFIVVTSKKGTFYKKYLN
jgi:hypothetical protein